MLKAAVGRKDVGMLGALLENAGSEDGVLGVVLG